MPSDSAILAGLRDVTDIRLSRKALTFKQRFVAAGTATWGVYVVFPTVRGRRKRKPVRIGSAVGTIGATGQYVTTVKFTERGRALLRANPRTQVLLRTELRLKSTGRRFVARRVARAFRRR